MVLVFAKLVRLSTYLAQPSHDKTNLLVEIEQSNLVPPQHKSYKSPV